MSSTLLTILISFFAYSLLNTGQLMQKAGLDRLLAKRSGGMFIWITGNLATITSTFFVLAALSFGQVSLVGAMAGSGLATMAIFSRIFMNEKPARGTIQGIGVIFLGVALLGAFSHPGPSIYDAGKLLTFGIFLLAVFLVLIFISRKSALQPPIIAGLAGSVAGFSTLYQKTADLYSGAPPVPDRWISPIRQGLLSAGMPENLVLQITHVFNNPYVPLWIGLSITSLAIMHLSYAKGKAVLVIPLYSSFFILVPVTGGVVGFQEVLHPIQWGAALIIILGSIVLNVRSGEESG